MMRLIVRPAVFCLAAMAMLAGCSDGPDRITTPSSAFNQAPVAAYFPLAPDYATVVSVRYSNGAKETVIFEVGEKQPLYEFEAYPLYAWDKYNNRTTSYVVVTDSALFMVASSSSSTPEKFLSLPLRPGAGWDRHDVSELTQYSADSDDGSIDIEAGNNDGTPDELYDDGMDDQADDGNDNAESAQDRPVLASFPTSGGTQMQVQTVESIVLSDGTVYAGAVRVANTGANGLTNYYWYVPGVGLAKYVLGASPRDPYTGSVVGEVVNYGVGLK
jgi:hypothetical protein